MYSGVNIMPTLLEFATDEQIRDEYKKSFMLNMFRKVCAKMQIDSSYKSKIKTLFRESHNKNMTTKIIIENNFNYDLTQEEAELMSLWFDAHFNNSNRRKSIPPFFKNELLKRQNGKCAVCGEDLATDTKKVHVDHIIPWSLVGDELEDNYQILCETCNECKSASTDYIFKNMIKLI